MAQVYRQHLDRELTSGGMPVALATLSLCVRAGQGSPEELAVRFEAHEPNAARKCVKALWRECSSIVKPGKGDEPFVVTRTRVADALAQIAPPSLFSELLAKIPLRGLDLEDEMPWEAAAREAVEQALANAGWNQEAKIIALDDPDEPRISVTVTSREELEQHLRAVASAAFYASCSRDEGEYVSECDEDGIVESALADYADRLEIFFTKTRRGGRRPPPGG